MSALLRIAHQIKKMHAKIMLCLNCNTNKVFRQCEDEEPTKETNLICFSSLNEIPAVTNRLLHCHVSPL
jgi:hypothetical protein